MANARFDSDAVASARHDLVIGVRAGKTEHRLTPVWAVVVEGRVFIRSWGLSERSWFTAFRQEPSGVAEIGGREYPVRAVHTRSQRLRDAVDAAYRLKYHTGASVGFVADMTTDRSRDTTTELVPIVRRTS